MYPKGALALALGAVLVLVATAALAAKRAPFRTAPTLYDYPHVYPRYTARPLLEFDDTGRCAAWCSQKPCTVWCR